MESGGAAGREADRRAGRGAGPRGRRRAIAARLAVVVVQSGALLLPRRASARFAGCAASDGRTVRGDISVSVNRATLIRRFVDDGCRLDGSSRASVGVGVPSGAADEHGPERQRPFGRPIQASRRATDRRLFTDTEDPRRTRLRGPTCPARSLPKPLLQDAEQRLPGALPRVPLAVTA